MQGHMNVSISVLISFHTVLCKSYFLRNLNTAIKPFRNESLTQVDATVAVTVELDLGTDILKV